MEKSDLTVRKKSVVTLFEDIVNEFPEQVGIIYKDKNVTYSEINNRANLLAARLHSLGVKKGDFVGVMVKKSENLIFSILGVMKIGAVYVPLTPDYPLNRIKYIFDDAGLMTVIVSASLHDKMKDIAAGVKIVTEPVQEALEDKMGLNQLPVLQTGDDDIAYLFYTSGSSGNPKGVLIHQAGFANRILWQKKYFDMTHNERCLFKSPIGFDISLWEIFLPLTSGATLVIAKEEGYKDVGYLVDLIRDLKITIAQFVPSLLRIFLNKLTEENLAGEITLKRVVSSGEELSPQLVKKFYHTLAAADLYNFYGPTETSICVTAKKLEKNMEESYVSLGEPIDQVNIDLMDDNLIPITEEGVKGEIFISGVCVGKGYLNLPELTNECFLKSHKEDKGVFYKTGDIAKYVDGELVYIGRKDRTLKVNGYRVDLGEIEIQINRLPMIESGIVKVFEKPSRAKVIVVFYRPADAGESPKVLEQQMIDELKKCLPHYMIPNLFIVKDEFKLTHNGKVDLTQLELQEENIAALDENKNYQQVYSLFYKYIGTIVSDGEDFFESGGSSIEAIEILECVNKEFNVCLSYVDLMDNYTIKEIIRAIEADASARKNECV